MSQATQTVSINGEDVLVPAPLTVAQLLVHLGISTSHVAVERNRKLVPKKEHATTEVSEGDRFEIVTFVGGG